MKQKITAVHLADIDEFENTVNVLLEEGWKISSTYCGFCNSEKYDFACSWHAILIKEIP